ncbi:MAG: 16S rRNA (cytidine(1402)-2'-O)-methyltransferase [Planctomycetes bacterium]|nr:16S rRNA (cytidine(1402)-2'-O)-methyltransferase [Planctomycetota bacterium]
MLYLIATPIGNLEDITLRALRVLGEVEALACEDTRITRKIFQRHEIALPQTIFSYHEHNEAQAGRKILDLLEQDLAVGLCTNAGYPGISDPGYRIASEAIEAGFEVQVLPGPGAVEAALLSSGLSTSSFTFKGFPPRKEGKRQRFLEMEKDLPHTLIIYESPHRTAKLLASALAVFGDRRAAVCIELTKKFEKVRRGYLSELLSELAGKTIKGEVAVVIAGNNEKFIRDSETDEGEA